MFVRKMRGGLLLGLSVLVTLISACEADLPPTSDASVSDAARPDGGVRDSGPARDGGPPAEECPDGCLVGGTCYPDGAPDPANPCQLCDADLAPTGFSANAGASCDDGAFCTTDDACTAAGACEGTYRTCEDGIACNGVATCDETSSACQAGVSTCETGQFCDALSGACVLECAGCLIDGSCYGDGQIDSLNPCRVCAVATSRSGWSANDGATCDDGLFCTTGDVCAASACVGGGARACDDGVDCNGAEVCDEAVDACALGATTCSAAQICDVSTDACIATCTGCVIDGACYGAGQRNPANQCEVCATATSRSAWSTNDGASCDDGLFCTDGDACSGTTCGGTARDCGDGILCNGGEICDETTRSCEAGTSTCFGGQVCDTASDACVTTCSGCVIGGSCYGAGQVNPMNSCEVCDIASSRTDWSDNDGARCDDGLFCTDGDTCGAGVCAGAARACSDGVSCNGTETCDETAGSCSAGSSTCAATEICNTSSDTCVTTCAGCVIGGICYADGSRNPANPCEICDTVRSRAAFSANDGASCDDGTFCTIGDACSGGLCAGSSATSFCTDGVTCNGTETCNETTDSCSPGATTCGAGEVCDPGSSMCVTACSGCVIGGVCYAPATRNPTNQCQVCAPATSATAWSPNTGASCDDGLFCTVADLCDALAVCGGAARACDDGVSCNGAETCNEGGGRCDAGAPSCGAGRVCDTATDMCMITCSGCVIGGVCHAAGAIDPANPCQSCQTATSTVGWSPRTAAPCDDGAYCTTGETCSAAAVCGGGVARACDDAVACNGDETCNESTDRCDAGTTTCTGGEICNTTTDMCVLSCVGGTTRCGGACTNTAFDPANCGGCGTSCGAVTNATSFCASSSCAFSCDGGFADCSAAAGCETNIDADDANCGACGNACGATESCVDGLCVEYATSTDSVLIPSSTGCSLLEDSNADQIDALTDGTVVAVLRCGADLRVSSSTDAARTWTAPVTVGVGLSTAATVFARSADDIFVMYAVGADVSIRRTLDRGATWSAPVVVGTGFASTGPGPSLNLVGRGATLYATWSSHMPPNTAFVRTSTDDGASWSSLPMQALAGINYCPDILFDDSTGDLLYINEVARQLFRLPTGAPAWAPVGTGPGTGFSDFAGGGAWTYSTGATSQVWRSPADAGAMHVITTQATGGFARGSMDADGDGDLYVVRPSSGSVQLYRWVAGAATISAAVPVAVSSPSPITALASPPVGDASVTLIYSSSASPIRVHVQAY